jgi:hypothetical protein
VSGLENQIFEDTSLAITMIKLFLIVLPDGISYKLARKRSQT